MIIQESIIVTILIAFIYWSGYNRGQFDIYKGAMDEISKKTKIINK